MNLDYNEEQIMLREQIQKFCESEYDFYKREEVIKSDKHFDVEVWKLFADQGWLSMPFSEESGGLGFGPIELSILFEEFGTLKTTLFCSERLVDFSVTIGDKILSYV